MRVTIFDVESSYGLVEEQGEHVCDQERESEHLDLREDAQSGMLKEYMHHTTQHSKRTNEEITGSTMLVDC